MAKGRVENITIDVEEFQIERGISPEHDYETAYCHLARQARLFVDAFVSQKVSRAELYEKKNELAALLDAQEDMGL